VSPRARLSPRARTRRRRIPERGALALGAALVATLTFAPPLARPALAVAPTPTQPYLLYGNESIATADGAEGALYNPALVGLRYPAEALVSFSRYNFASESNDGLFSWKGTGLRFTRIKDQAQYFGFTQAFGSPTFRFGWTAEWHRLGYSQSRVLNHHFGVVMRPEAWLSLAATMQNTFQPALEDQRQYRTYTLGAGIRPLALSPRLASGAGTRMAATIDAVIPDDGQWRQTRIRVGGELELLPGVVARGALDDHGGWHAGLTLRAPHWSVASHGAFSRSEPGPTSYVISAHSGGEPSVIPTPHARRVAVVRVAGALGDEAASGLSLLGGSEARTPVGPIHAQLEHALNDPLTRGVLLDLGGATNMAAIEELRPRIAALRAARKPVVAYLEEGGGRADLFLASACDRVFASEEALFWQLGLRAERRYYRGLLARWGVRVDRSSIGKYKSAYRELSVDSTGTADREEIESALDRYQKEFVNALARDRRVDAARFEHVLDGREWSPADLVSAGLADSVGYREQALAELGRLAGLGAHPRGANLARDPGAARDWRVPTGIAVVYASGDIEPGESGNDLLSGPTLGSSTLSRQIQRAFRAPDVRAVVFRVDSPGGSVLASNLIAHTLERLHRETAKPLVVSMGSLAASGGYYVSLPGQRLFADRFTRTGSIGVLFLHPSLEGWYAQHGVRQDEFERGDYMRGGSLGRDWDAASQAAADSAIARTYDRFVGRVAASRSLSRDRVLEVAQGRVWMGEEAKARGLVDEVGGLDAAIGYARRAAGIDPAQKLAPREYHRPRAGFVQRVLGAWWSTAVSREAQLHDPYGERLEADDALPF
jgi:protease-4